MPKISAIICEYNPMHAGHMHHISETRRLTGCEYVVCIMSGSFTQRGEPAVFDKFSRTRAALVGGADMVIELPTLFACASAEKFALGGVYIADRMNIVDCLSFGCEDADVDSLKRLAAMLCDEPAPYRAALRRFLDEGMSFPSARVRAVRELFPDTAGLLASPNNILAVEYLKALRRIDSKIAPVAVRRDGSGYLDTRLSPLPSALAVREALKRGDALDGLLPDELGACFSRPALFSEALFLPAMLKLRTMSIPELDAIEGVAEGLSYRLKEAAKTAKSYDELLELTKTKRYTHARLRRVLLNVILDIKKDAPALPSYVRVLGVRRGSKALLSELSHRSELPVVVSPAGCSDPELLRDLAATDIRALLESPPAPAAEDLTHGLVIV